MKKILAIILYSCFCTNILFSQVYLTKEQAWEDIDEYFATIAIHHPDMYWHSSKTDVDAFITWIKNKCRDSMTVGEFALYMGHSHHLFDTHTSMDDWTHLSIRTDKVFPEIEFLDGKIYLKENRLQVDSINSISVNRILSWQLEVFGGDWSRKYLEFYLSANGEFCRSVNDFDIHPPYRVSVLTKEGKDSVVILKGMDRSYWEEYCKNKTGKEEPYGFELYPLAGIGIIRYNDIFWREDYPEADSLLHRFMLDCREKRIRYLFFDVSRNTGGYDREFSMFFPYIRMNRRKCYQREIETKKKIYMDAWCGNNKEQPNIKPFNGKIFVYQSIYSQSGTPDFCAIMKTLADAVLVGTETGSGIPLYTSAQHFNLKNSGLEYRVSTKLWKSESPRLPRTSEGYLLPDIQYPFLTDRLLNVEDCKIIIEKSKH